MQDKIVSEACAGTSSLLAGVTGTEVCSMAYRGSCLRQQLIEYVFGSAGCARRILLLRRLILAGRQIPQLEAIRVAHDKQLPRRFLWNADQVTSQLNFRWPEKATTAGDGVMMPT